MGKNKKKAANNRNNVVVISKPHGNVSDNALPEEESSVTSKLTDIDQNEAEKSNDNEIKELRQQIEELKSQIVSSGESNENDDNRSKELSKLTEERNHFEHQYNTLLNRLSSMKTVFSKMKEAQEELETCQDQLREYETQNLSLKNKLDNALRDNSELTKTISSLNKEVLDLNDECESLTKDSDDLRELTKALKKDLEGSRSETSTQLEEAKRGKQQLIGKMQEMELLLANKNQDVRTLSQELESVKITRDAAVEARKTLETKLRETETLLVQEKELRTREFSSKDAEADGLSRQINSLTDTIAKLEKQNAELKSTIEKLKPESQAKEQLQQECKEKTLQIGKLRHEAIILNEHLTKALAMLKTSNDSESVDKELISNLLISFVAIPRGDSKKFEVLELISSFLSWDNDKKRQAGLLRTANGLNDVKSGSRTESFVSMWTEFLEKESEK
ncbi:LAMI_0H06326g1_1 [Lachancea mirantina]|uniref:LAMI_0H06326g1_1 n=1 Tax=Lachancea mirantina TaxID=1230905 RepID=A0A1G4KF80_9SACH|nr:LAMI_0H06326g1_1 [Lachancea mirantina]